MMEQEQFLGSVFSVCILCSCLIGIALVVCICISETSRECEKRFVQGDPQLVDLLKKFSKSLEYIRKLTLIFRRGIHYPAFYWFCVAKSELFEKWAFSNFSCIFQIPIFFSNLNSNCSNFLDMRNLQEQVKKAFCYQKLTLHWLNKLFQ